MTYKTGSTLKLLLIVALWYGATPGGPLNVKAQEYPLCRDVCSLSTPCTTECNDPDAQKEDATCAEWGVCEPEPFCGDGICNNDETCSSCQSDCPGACGNECDTPGSTTECGAGEICTVHFTCVSRNHGGGCSAGGSCVTSGDCCDPDDLCFGAKCVPVF